MVLFHANDHHDLNPSILLDNFEIETYHPHIEYPSTRDFLRMLDHTDPHRHWTEYFLTPLTKLGVHDLDDIGLITPECLYLCCRLPPILIMDFFARANEVIQTIHDSRPLLVARQQH